jgi:hypothetical protein
MLLADCTRSAPPKGSTVRKQENVARKAGCNYNRLAYFDGRILKPMG